MATTVPVGTVGSGTALISAAKRSHSTRPSAMPAGMPTAQPISAATRACTATAMASRPRVKPSVLRMARSAGGGAPR